MYQYVLGGSWLESSSAENNHGVLLDNKLALSQHHTVTSKKANSIQG